MNRSEIGDQLSKLVANHVPRNARSFKFRIYDGEPMVSGLGFSVDPKPFDGAVIAVTQEAIVVKTGRIEFAVLDRKLVTEVPDEGALVHVEPYVRRRFDGQRADTPEVRTAYTADGDPYTITSQVLGAAPAKLPIPEPQCPELRELIQQLEQLPAPDGLRRITHLLVDAGAHDITWVDPTPSKIIETPPSITCSVSTAKFEGQLTVLYERGPDSYAIELRRAGELLERVDEVYFDVLGDALARRIDDGRWRQIRVSVVGAAGAVRRPAATRSEVNRTTH